MSIRSFRSQPKPVCRRRHIESRTGEAPELNIRAVWPSDAMPGLVERWTEDFQPDLVWPLRRSLLLLLSIRAAPGPAPVGPAGPAARGVGSPGGR